MLIRYGMLCDNKELPDIVAELNFWYKEQDAGVKREEPEEVKRQQERPETIEVGSNILAGCDPEKIIKSVDVMLNRERNWKNPFGDGNASERIITSLYNP